MRIVVFSDTHQNTALLMQSVRQAMSDGIIDVLIHCGDGVRDLDAVEGALLMHNPRIRIYAVRGNCDLTAFQYPGTETVTLNGVRTMITHGHLYQVKHGLGQLSKSARDMGMRLVFFGHTHQMTVKEKHGVLLLNPGSLAALSLDGKAYLEVVIGKDQSIREIFIKHRPIPVDN